MPTLTNNDEHHLSIAINLLEKAKTKGLVGVIHGAFPDAGDEYSLATDSVALTDYYNCAGNLGESEGA
jgi:hypothetical protein